MAVAEAPESRKTVRAAGLTAALILAKLAALWNRGVTLSWSMLPACLWQDFLVGLAFWLLDATFRRTRWMWLPYAALATYVAINVAVVATLGSPLTWTMLRATGGPLGDSMWSALTPAVVFTMSSVVAAAVVGPWLAGRVAHSTRRASMAVALLLTVGGVITARRIDTAGLERNAITSLALSSASRVTSASSEADFRSSPIQQLFGEDLTQYRGAAAGLNVLVVGLESTAARYLASYGAKDDPTPFLTAMASESIVFESAYAVYPESIKGLFALLCSVSPAIDVPAETLARTPCDSVVRRFSSAGYRTGLFHAGRFSYLGMRGVLDVQRFDVADDAGTIGGNLHSSFGIDEPAVVNRILDWIDRANKTQPFFALYLPTAGHHPYQSGGSGPFPEDTALGAYKNAIHEGDRSLGTLIDGLRTRELLDRTLVVVFSDHGQAFDQHPGNRVHSLYVYDENVRVPLVFRLPRLARPSAGPRVRRIASVIDIGPTILDVAGLPVQTDIEGRTLLTREERMALFFADYDRAWLGLRDGCWKFLLEIEANRSRLFDVCADADETRDLASTDRRRVDAYRARVKEWAAARRATVLATAQAR